MTVSEEKETKILPCDLKEHEIKERGEELAKVTKELDEVGAEAKTSAARYREKLGGLHNDATRLAEAIETGKEDREVEIEETKDYYANTINTVRCDTGEVLATRQMTDEERQANLALN